MSENNLFELLNGEKSEEVIRNLQELLLSDDMEMKLESLKTGEKIFLHFLSIKNVYVNGTSSAEETPQKEFLIQMDKHYKDFKNSLLNFLGEEDEKIQATSLDVLMSFIRQEGKYPFKNKSVDEKCFLDEFCKIICKLIKTESDSSSLINHCKIYLEYDDIKLYTLKAILEIINSEEINTNEYFLNNTFNLLCKINFPQSSDGESNTGNISKVFITKTGSEQFVLKLGAFQSEFSRVWVTFLKKKLSDNLRKKVLVYLPKRVLPHLRKPLLLADFFTDAFNIGGVVSLLALSGIFFLMKNCNLEYPDFYKQLYSLFDIDIIRSKYNRRFFDSSYLFLTSALLPEYIVAAFVKRLARLTLYAPIDVLFIILPFIQNLLIRHPSLKILIHDQHERSINVDPFDFEELDFEKCNAMQSSLWEIKSLQTHWHPDISTKANFINSELGPGERNLSSALDIDLDTILENEQAARYKDYPLSTDFYNQ